MAYAMTFKPDFLERCKRMSGLKSNAAFAGAIGVSESVLSKAMHTNISRPRARERKPAWLRAFIPKTSPLVTAVCEGCGLYVIEDRETVWESWDYGCVAGDDLTVAIILGRPLTRVTWLPSVGHPLLRSTCGDAGIRPDGQYLAMHMCHLARISVKPFKPPKRERPPGKPWGGPKLSKQEIAEFKRIWNMPYSRLKYEKAPTMVGQGEKQTLF